MRTFDRALERRAKVDERVSIGQSVAVITGLCVLSWGVVILFVMGLRAVL